MRPDSSDLLMVAEPGLVHDQDVIDRDDVQVRDEVARWLLSGADRSSEDCAGVIAGARGKWPIDDFAYGQSNLSSQVPRTDVVAEAAIGSSTSTTEAAPP